MNTKIADLMTSPVMTATPHQSMSHIKSVLRDNSASCLPVVNSDHEPVGIVTSSDLLGNYPDGAPVSNFMTKKVYAAPQYNDVSIAARIMRKHKVHHVIVTHEKKVVGIISSYDLLQLVEDHRFVMKNPPTESNKKSGKGKQQEASSKPR